MNEHFTLRPRDSTIEATVNVYRAGDPQVALKWKERS